MYETDMNEMQDARKYIVRGFGFGTIQLGRNISFLPSAF
jgi:hypothetical protein